MPRLKIGALVAAACLATAVASTTPLARGARTAATTSPPAASIVEQSFVSSQVRGTLRFRVYLPAGYASSSTRYPVIYLLHGLPNAGTNYRDGKLATIGASAERAGRPVIVVAPQASRPGDTDPEFHDWGHGRNWESAIAGDLVRTIDSRFRTIARRGARGIIGISAGGYGATIIALHRPGTFSVAQSWSGYFSPTDARGRPLSVGNAAANRRANVHSFVAWLAKTHAVRLQFFVGDGDGRFRTDNLRLDQELTRAHVAHEFAVYPGGHSASLWSSHLGDWITTLIGALPAVPRQQTGT